MPSTDTTTTESAPRHSFQISLRGLLLIVTYCAVSFSLAAIWNVGVLVLMAGILLTWLSFRGRLAFLQSSKARPKVFGVAWVLFGTSMFLPAMVVNGCNNTRTVEYGWQIAWSGAVLTIGGVEEVVPPDSEWQKNVKLLALSFVWSLPNFLMLASPFFYFWRGQNGTALSSAWGCAAVSSWMWGPLACGDLRIGYAVWAIAILLEFLRHTISRRTMAIMIVFGVVAYLLPIITDA